MKVGIGLLDEALLSIEDLSVTFLTRQGMVGAVYNVSLTLHGGETLAVVGETGSGKSVVATAVLRLLPPYAVVSGRIGWQGRNLLELAETAMDSIRANEICSILQNAALALNPVVTVGRQLATWLHRLRGLPKHVAGETVRQAFRQLGFADPEAVYKAYPFQLSGGMSQRVLNATALLAEVRLIIADEPTKGLDTALVAEVTAEIKRVQAETGAALFLITHDFDAAGYLAEKTAVMYAGQVVEVARTSELLAAPCHPYTQGLLAGLPENGFTPLPGAPPLATTPPSGCRFHPRCKLARPICQTDEPPCCEVKGRMVRCWCFC